MTLMDGMVVWAVVLIIGVAALRHLKRSLKAGCGAGDGCASCGGCRAARRSGAPRAAAERRQRLAITRGGE